MCLCCCSALGRYRGRCCSPPIYRGGLLIYRWSKSASCAAATAACRSCRSASWTLLAANGRSRCGFTGFSSAALAAGSRWCAGSRRGATLGCWSCSLFLVLAALCGALRLCARGGSTLRRCRLCLLVPTWGFGCIFHEEDSLLSIGAPQVAAGSLFTAIAKDCHPSPCRKVRQSLVVAGQAYSVCALWRLCYVA